MSDNQHSKEDLPSESDYDKLRALIVGHEVALVEELQHRLDNKQLRTDDLAEVLEAALRQSHANGANLAQAIEEPVQVCLKKSKHEKLPLRYTYPYVKTAHHILRGHSTHY